MRRGALKQALHQPSRVQSGIREALLRPPLCEMSDCALLQRGLVVKFGCSQGADPDNPSQRALLLEMEELRAEWKKRFPRLPLSVTLDELKVQTSVCEAR